MGVDARGFPGGLLRLDSAFAYVKPPSSWPLPRAECLMLAPNKIIFLHRVRNPKDVNFCQKPGAWVRTVLSQLFKLFKTYKLIFIQQLMIESICAWFKITDSGCTTNFMNHFFQNWDLWICNFESSLGGFVENSPTKFHLWSMSRQR